MVCSRDRIFKNETVPLNSGERGCYSQRSEGASAAPSSAWSLGVTWAHLGQLVPSVASPGFYGLALR